MRIFTAEDYHSLSNDNRRLVDDWLWLKGFSTSGFKFIQEDSTAELRVQTYKFVLPSHSIENDFPWSVLDDKEINPYYKKYVENRREAKK